MDNEVKALLDQEKANYVANMTPSDFVQKTIYENAQKTNDVKEVVNLATTARALQERETVEKLSSEKTEELVKDAEAKKIKAESNKIHEETQKIHQETEQIRIEKEKAQAYFEANKEILKCVNVRSPLTLSAMRKWFSIACVIYAIFQFILLPLTLIGFATESVISIVGAVCKSIAKQGLRIVVAIMVAILIVGLVGGIYWVIINKLSVLI